MRHNKRTDRSQLDIVKDLRARGVQVIVTNFGSSFPDLLIGYRLRNWLLVEVKEPNGCFDRGQLQFLADACGPVAVATTADEAAFALHEGKALQTSQKDKIAAWLLRNPTQETLSVKKFRAVIG